MNQTLFETILDNSPDGIYVIDEKGNYVYANRTYIKMVNMSKTELLHYNIHDFLNTGQIDICISDIVFQKKHRVCMFQDLYDKHNNRLRRHRQLVISCPIFGDQGEICNIVAFVRPLTTINDDYHQASSKQPIALTAAMQKKGCNVIAESAAMKGILEQSAMIADTDSSVLLTGESGTGKEVVAEYIHQNSPRKKRQMIVINCASLPPTLLEAELFGYEKGAFTGAANSKPGLFEEADGSTLFLDEINSLPMNLQGTMLRAIETKHIQRIGSTKLRAVDFRLIVATNEDLGELVREKRFRADLYYRLNVIPLRLPPLRERREDILALALYFLTHYCSKYNKNKAFTPQTLSLIHEFDWPGNVRELKNFVERSIVMSSGDFIEIKSIAEITGGMQREKSAPDPAQAQEGCNYAKMIADGITLSDHVNACEAAYVRYALDTYKSSYLAAEALGTSQASIIRKKRKL